MNPLQVNLNLITLTRGHDFLKMVVREESGPWHIWIYGVGSPEEMSKFAFKVRLYNAGVVTELSHTGVVISIDKSVDDVINDNDGFVVTDAGIKKLRKLDEFLYEVFVTQL